MGIKYKASDLVSAAVSLADLENSSFITSTENRMYINNAWEEIYQKAIDYGELYYLKKINVVPGDNNLPEDFYQLYNIKDENWNDIPRYNKNCDRNTRWYRIENNKLYINGEPSSPFIEYFPAPETLDISGSGDVELDFPNNIYKMLLVYRLAEYYKVRQNGDISGIELLEDKAWKQFYDMLTRDDNEESVIKDVYGKRNWWY